MALKDTLKPSRMHLPISIAILVSLPFALGQTQQDPASLPARDSHEGLLVAADPYQDATRYKTRFGKKNPYDAGILAIEVYFRNDSDKPIRLDLEAIRLLLSPPGFDKQRLGPLSAEDVADRILNRGASDPTARRRPLPVPGRGPKTGHGKEWDELVASLRAGAFESDLLPPRGTVHGLFFFDIDRRYDWLAYARLYIPDLRFMTDKKALLFFDVDLAAARPH